MAWFSNPIAFTRGPVTIITTLVYIAVITAVIFTQTRVPPSPSNPVPVAGINLTEAWNDLQLLTAQYHPYNSRRNDEVHGWLVQRIKSILSENKASKSSAYLFEDNTSNLTFSSAGSASSAAGVSVYFEGTNIITYIRGTEDDQSDWWTEPKTKPSVRNGVLVNAHYDSVSTGYGATDDGVGVISVLQLIKYFTSKGHTPANGLVLLLNNGEEDFLNGASVFSQHPMSKLVSSFLNLEGAGAGGRAALFRSTDDEVTRAYGKSPYPFGTVISADAFQRGTVRSQTDYVVFNGKLGLRGLDVAFIAPRARYHTDEDDSRHTGKDAMWHMISAALATTKELTKDSPRISASNLATQMAPSSEDDISGHPAIWFDIFGLVFAVMRAHTFFALCVTVLVVGPILLILTLVLLYRADKFYLFSSSRRYHTMDGDESLPLKGWRGFFRFPLVLVLSCAAPVALAYLIFKVNPFIAHSSQWAVWSMMVSSFVFVAWFCCRSLDSVRPSAMTRVYGLSWLCGAWWVVLVAETVFEEHLHVYGGYFVLFYTATLFIATWLAYLELFSLPKKSRYCKAKLGAQYQASRSTSMSRPATATQSVTGRDEDTAGDHEEEVTESSSLLRNNRGRSAFKNYSRSNEGIPEDEDDKPEEEEVYNNEQEWSKSMWSWMWILELLILIPINVVLLGQIAVLLVTALHQTGSDGSSIFVVYLGMAILTIFLFSPLVPLLHRFTWHIPLFLLLVLIGTLIYNMLAFPFSSHNRLKVFFQQEVDINNGTNTVSLIGIPGFVEEAISYIPSASGQPLNCSRADPRGDRIKCAWTGPAPKVASSNQFAIEKAYAGLVNFNVTLTSNGSDSKTARFVVYGKNTRACKLTFDSPIEDFYVSGQGNVDKRFDPVPRDSGSKEIRLWSRTWDRAWTVDVKWSVEDKTDRDLTGKVVCLWSDDNQNGVIPALDEVRHFVPEWVAVTKAADGLVEAFKRFKT